MPSVALSGAAFIEKYPVVKEHWSSKNGIAVEKLDALRKQDVYIWTGDCGHHWETKTESIIAGRACSYCSFAKILVGFNDLSTTNPEVAATWSPKNTIDIKTVTRGSQKIAIWECENGHEWTTKISNRINRGCPYCSNKKVLKGYNDALTTHPEWATEWIDERNITEFTAGSSYEALWRCPKGHEYKATLYRRLAGRGCNVCASKVVQSGVNDLISLKPEIAAQYHPDNKINIKNISIGSSRNVKWICDKGHVWNAIVKRRVRGDGCPTCSNRKVLAGFNDLLTTNPQLAEEWHPELNKMGSHEVVAGSKSIKAWWMCKKNPDHVWMAAIDNRNRGSGCPVCAKHTSGFENEIYEYVCSLLGVDNVQRNVKSVLSKNKLELDVYVPSLKLAFEANGVYWHSEAAGKHKGYHSNKLEMARESGIELIQIWQDQWIEKEEIIKSMIRHRLRLHTAKLYARNLTVRQITVDEARKFMDAHHIQGHTNGTYYLSLQKDEDICSVMTLTKQGDNLILDRYATSINVVGGHSKLISWVVKNVSGWKQIVTFADLEVSTGELYKKTGWVLDKILDPDYKYIYLNTRHHKFNFRLKRFKNDPNLIWEEGLTEKELADLNGLIRVWDSGKIRFVYPNPSLDDSSTKLPAKELVSN